MSVFEKLSAAFENRDADAFYNNLMADEVRFSSGIKPVRP